MQQAYTGTESLEAFAAAQDQFQALLAQLRSEASAELAHGEIERLIETEGTELLRRLLQGHLDLRALVEPEREAVAGRDGVVRRHHRGGCERPLESVFGRVRVRRQSYGARGAASLLPLDAALNLPPDLYSEGLRRRVAEEVARGSFEEAVWSIDRNTGGHVPKRQCEQIAVTVSQDFEAFYATRQALEPECTQDLLVMSADGKGIVMHLQDLREATRKAAERAASKRKARLSPGEKRNRKRMATVASIYTVVAHVRTAEAVMKVEENAAKQPRPKVQNKRVWASVVQPPEVVIAELFAEARRRDPSQRRRWVMLVDGEAHQLGCIQTTLNQQQAEVTVIVDFIHVLEYVWKAAHSFHPVGSQAAEDWVGQRALQILQGQASEVAEDIHHSATVHNLADKRQEAVDKCTNYLRKYRPYLCYDQYLAHGLPIATGVIEGACRHLVKDRMELTGARWRLPSAEAVLKLRSLRSSGDFEAYWRFHQAQELERNHLSQYAEYPLSEAA